MRIKARSGAQREICFADILIGETGGRQFFLLGTSIFRRMTCECAGEDYYCRALKHVKSGIYHLGTGYWLFKPGLGWCFAARECSRLLPTRVQGGHPFLKVEKRHS